MDENLIYRTAYSLAVKIVRRYQHLSDHKREFILSKQLVRSGTSIAANIAEAIGGISRADFSAKMSIAYKECRETKCWLDLLKDTGYIDEVTHQDVYSDTHEIGGILFSIVKTSRKRQ